MTILQISSKLSVSCILLRTKSHSSSFDMTSQIPSQASTMNSSWALRSSTKISGSGETSCSHGPFPTTFLYSKSPRARDTASDPLTRWIMTLPPALWMRSFSSGWKGLWSWVEKWSPPARDMTARESPQFAKNTFCGVTIVHTAVEPLLSSPHIISGIFLSLSSMLKNPVLIAFCTLSTDGGANSGSPGKTNSSFPVMDCKSWSEQYADTLAPACPSNTAKKDQSLRPQGRPTMALWASSISTRHPCMLLRA